LSNSKLDPVALLQKYYDPASDAYRILMTHCEMVQQKALSLAENVKHLRPDMRFIEEAALLHDIGIMFTDSPHIGCYGDKAYIFHGVLGRELLEKEGYPKHALVCERHIGVGLSRDDIIQQNLPLPQRDMLPLSLEEQIICFADKFFSKKDSDLRKERTIPDIRKKLVRFGDHKGEKIDEWIELFGL